MSKSLTGEVLPAAPAPPKIDLRDVEAVRREMGAVYRAMKSGEVATQDGTRLVYVLGEILKAHRQADEVARIEAIERILKRR